MGGVAAHTATELDGKRTTQSAFLQSLLKFEKPTLWPEACLRCARVRRLGGRSDDSVDCQRYSAPKTDFVSTYNVRYAFKNDGAP